MAREKQKPTRATLNRWEDEGGAQMDNTADPASAEGADSVPAGITTRLVREYLVGPYRYTDRDQAIAELHRQSALSANSKNAPPPR